MRIENWLYTLPLRVRSLIRRHRLQTELDEELRDHIDRQIADNLSRGMPAEEARLNALRAFGNPLLLNEKTRATWSWNGLEQCAHDLRIGFRTLRRSPGFALMAILIMAIGIGANVAIFTVVRSVLLQPLPYRDPGRLVSLFEHQTHPIDRGYSNYLPVAAGNFAEWKKATQGAAQIAIVSTWHQYNISAEEESFPKRWTRHGAPETSSLCSALPPHSAAYSLRTMTGVAPRLQSCYHLHCGGAAITAIRASWARPSGSMLGPSP